MTSFHFAGIDWTASAYKPATPDRVSGPPDSWEQGDGAEVSYAPDDPMLCREYPELIAFLLDRHGEELEEAAVKACEDAAVAYVEGREER